MNTYDIINEVRARGVILKRNCDKLRVSCAEGLLTEAQAEYIREHRDEILGIIDKEKKLQPDPPVTLPSYLEALACRIASLQAEYAALYGRPAPGEKETCRELSWKEILPAELQRKYNERYETLSLIERLKRERSAALAEGRDYWTPGPSDELLRQKSDGSFVPAELAELDAPGQAPDEVTVLLGKWNQRMLKKRAVKVSKTAQGKVSCELVGDIPKHEKEIPNGKIFKGTAQSLDGLKKGA